MELSVHARAFHIAWWREHCLRESISRRAGKEVAEIMAKRKDKGAASRPGTFFERWGIPGTPAGG